MLWYRLSPSIFYSQYMCSAKWKGLGRGQGAKNVCELCGRSHHVAGHLLCGSFYCSRDQYRFVPIGSVSYHKHLCVSLGCWHTCQPCSYLQDMYCQLIILWGGKVPRVCQKSSASSIASYLPNLLLKILHLNVAAFWSLQARNTELVRWPMASF